MKIILYTDRNKKDIRINDAIKNLHKYFANQNEYEYKLKEYTEYEVSDIAILWGIYCIHKDDTKFRKIIKYKQEKNKKKTLILEVGFLNRDKYYSFGWNSIVNFGIYNPHNMPSDRFEKLNIQLNNNYINLSGNILLCGQIPTDTQLQHINYEKWLFNIVNKIKLYSDKQIIYRPHPKLGKKKINNIPNTIKSLNLNLIDDFKNAYCVIAFNSNSLVDALLYGLPIFAFDSGSVVYEIANKLLENINNPIFPTNTDKIRILSNIAYMQWNSNELSNGDAFKHILQTY